MTTPVPPRLTHILLSGRSRGVELRWQASISASVRPVASSRWTRISSTASPVFGSATVRVCGHHIVDVDRRILATLPRKLLKLLFLVWCEANGYRHHVCLLGRRSHERSLGTNGWAWLWLQNFRHSINLITAIWRLRILSVHGHCPLRMPFKSLSIFLCLGLADEPPPSPGEIKMVITLPPELETALNELARKRGVAPEILALDALRDRLIAMTRVVEPRDEWERLVIQTGTNCGVSLPHEALSSEGLYE